MPQANQPYIDHEVRDVREFHRKFQLDVGDNGPRLLSRQDIMKRFDFMSEELEEFAKAIDSRDIVEMADALIDLVYVAKGTAVMMGLPWERLWNDVQRANMSKVRYNDVDDHKCGVGKPAGWQGPTTETILALHGYSTHAPETSET